MVMEIDGLQNPSGLVKYHCSYSLSHLRGPGMIRQELSSVACDIPIQSDSDLIWSRILLNEELHIIQLQYQSGIFL